MFGKHASPAEQSGSDDNPIVGGAAAALPHGKPLPAWRVAHAARRARLPVSIPGERDISAFSTVEALHWRSSEVS